MGGDVAITKRELDEKKAVINKYKRIDQITLSRLGFKQKQMLQETAIDEVFNFTQLQRFRQNRDLQAFDKSRPMAVAVESDSDASGSDSDDGEPENQNLQNNKGGKYPKS